MSNDTDVSEVGFQMQRARKVYAKRCENPNCDVTFRGIRTAKFCSRKCRNAVYYANKKERS